MFTYLLLLLVGSSAFANTRAQSPPAGLEPRVSGAETSPGSPDQAQHPGNPTDGKEAEYEEITGNEIDNEYREDFQDNRIRIMLQPKKSVALNATELKTWKAGEETSRKSIPPRPSIASRRAMVHVPEKESPSAADELLVVSAKAAPGGKVTEVKTMVKKSSNGKARAKVFSITETNEVASETSREVNEKSENVSVFAAATPDGKKIWIGSPNVSDNTNLSQVDGSNFVNFPGNFVENFMSSNKTVAKPLDILGSLGNIAGLSNDPGSGQFASVTIKKDAVKMNVVQKDDEKTKQIQVDVPTENEDEKLNQTEADTPTENEDKKLNQNEADTTTENEDEKLNQNEADTPTENEDEKLNQTQVDISMENHNENSNQTQADTSTENEDEKSKQTQADTPAENEDKKSNTTQVVSSKEKDDEKSNETQTDTPTENEDGKLQQTEADTPKENEDEKLNQIQADTPTENLVEKSNQTQVDTPMEKLDEKLNQTQVDTPIENQDKKSKVTQADTPIEKPDDKSNQTQVATPMENQDKKSNLTQADTPIGNLIEKLNQTQADTPTEKLHEKSKQTEADTQTENQDKKSKLTQTDTPIEKLDDKSNQTQVAAPTENQDEKSKLTQADTPAENLTEKSNQTQVDTLMEKLDEKLNQTPVDSPMEKLDKKLNQTEADTPIENQDKKSKVTQANTLIEKLDEKSNQTQEAAPTENQDEKSNQTQVVTSTEKNNEKFYQTQTDSPKQNTYEKSNQTQVVTQKQNQGEKLTRTKGQSLRQNNQKIIPGTQRSLGKPDDYNQPLVRMEQGVNGVDMKLVNTQETPEFDDLSEEVPCNGTSSEDDVLYEELEPDPNFQEDEIEYLSPHTANGTKSGAIIIVLPDNGSNQMDMNAPQTNVVPQNMFGSDVMAKNIFNLLVNLTAINAVNERNGRKILEELQKQKANLHHLRKQSDAIYQYITKTKNN